MFSGTCRSVTPCRFLLNCRGIAFVLDLFCRESLSNGSGLAACLTSIDGCGGAGFGNSARWGHDPMMRHLTVLLIHYRAAFMSQMEYRANFASSLFLSLLWPLWVVSLLSVFF